jgi:hypothetical protein
MDAGQPALPHPALVPVVDLGDARGVTEIRVHGVGGATPDSMLWTADPRQVAGDHVAGFYRAPDPAPDRHVEAYSWGGLTSYSRVRALWVLLLPFMLANLAGWVSPPRHDATPGTTPVHRFRLAAARWGALAMTLSVLMTAELIAVDVIAYQCGGSASCVAGAFWRAPLGWGGLGANPGHRLLLGSALLVAALGGVALLSRASGRRYEAVPPPWSLADQPGRAAAAPSAAHLPGGLADRGFWQGLDAHSRLNALHLCAGVGLVTLVLLGCTAALDAPTPPVAVVLRAVAVGSAAVALLGAVVLLWYDRPPVPAHLAQWPARLVLALALLAFTAAAVAVLLTDPPATLVAGQTPGMVLAFNLTWTLISLLLAPLALSTLRGGRASHRRDPCGIGWIPPFAALGLGIVLVQVGLLSLLVVTAQSVAGGPGVVYENGYRVDPGSGGPVVLPPMVEKATAALLYGLLLALLVGLAAFVTNYVRAGRGAGLAAAIANPDGSGGDYDGELATNEHTPDQAGTPGAWRASAAGGAADGVTAWTRRRIRWEFLARSSVVVSWVVNGVALAAVVGLLVVWFFVWLLGKDPPMYVGPVAWLAVAIPPALVGFVAAFWRDLSRRRVIGTLWDVGTFWPRAFHPFAPPCYAERAVPELMRRVWWLNDADGDVVVVAHSQGSVVAVAAALQSGPRTGGRPHFSLVTYGSPVRKLYGNAFPAYWSAEAIESVTDPERSLVLPGRWRNVHYLTDYIGGRMRVDHIDRRLPDPQSSIHVYAQPEPRVRSHTGYHDDPRFRAVVDELVEAAAARAPDGHQAPGRS